jgi:hypothetical protein
MYGIVTGCTARRDTVDVRPQARMYGQCGTGDFTFTSHLIAPVFLTLELF